MKIGSKIICIDASIPPYTNMINFYLDFKEWIAVDRIYIVRDIFDNDGLVTSIVLEGVHNTPRFFKSIQRLQEPSFRIDRFRELEEDKIVESVEQEEFAL